MVRPPTLRQFSTVERLALHFVCSEFVLVAEYWLSMQGICVG